MADMDISIGGRSYRVACRDGEEKHLAEVAGLLATEAGALRQQFGALPENRLLLMAGLMVADRLHGSRHELAEALAASGEAPQAGQPGLFDSEAAEQEIADLRAMLEEARTRAADAAEAEARAEAAEARAKAMEARLAEAEAGEEAALAAFEDAAGKLRDLGAGLRAEATA